MAIAEQLTALQETKTAIKKAIEGKGQDLTNVPFTQYAEKITAIQSGGGSGGTVDTSGKVAAAIVNKTVTDISPADVDYINLKVLNMTNDPGVFKGCTALTKFISTRENGVITGYYWFQECEALERVEIYRVQGQSVFNKCKALKYIKIYDFKKTDFVFATFGNCTALEVFDLSEVSEVQPVGNNNIFFGITPLTDKNRYIVVPDSLLSGFSSDSSWKSAIADKGFVFIGAKEAKDKKIIK